MRQHSTKSMWRCIAGYSQLQTWAIVCQHKVRSHEFLGLPEGHITTFGPIRLCVSQAIHGVVWALWRDKISDGSSLQSQDMNASVTHWTVQELLIMAFVFSSIL